MSENLSSSINPMTINGTIGNRSIKGNITNSITLVSSMSVPSKMMEKDYDKLNNKPSINGVELSGDRSFEDLGRLNMRNIRIKSIIDNAYNEIFGG